MKIARVRIENFRSIEETELYPDNICALVGENNAGKTNVLSALDFLLGEAYPMPQRLNTSDFYNENTDRPVWIEVEFEPNPDNILRVWCEFGGIEGGAAKMQFRGNDTEYRLTGKIREKCALVYLSAGRSLEYHLGYSRWTLFGRIIRQLDQDFRQNFSERREALAEHFEKAHEVLRTDLYEDFHHALRDSFSEQLNLTEHDLKLDFRTYEPDNFYRSLRPILIEDGDDKSPSASGQGMRNLIVLSLFRAYAKVFRGDAIIAVEEPETYLHPHAQRSLAAIFNELAEQGNQIMYSTHSGNFIDVAHFDRICLLEKCPDSQGQQCTNVKQVSADELLSVRQELYPKINMSVVSMRERYRNIYGLEQNEAFFARKIIVVEGPTEEYSLPIYARHLGYDLDANGVSIVSARGKHALDSFYQLYRAFGIPTYIVFDNDRGGKANELKKNAVLLKMLGEDETEEPDGTVTDSYAIIEHTYETALKEDLDQIDQGKYESLAKHANYLLGGDSKGLKARFMAKQLTKDNIVPTFIAEIIEAVRRLGEETDDNQMSRPQDEWPISEEDFDDIPF